MNVRFALVLVGAGVLVGLVGTIIPQVPSPMRGNPAARAAWIELQREDFGTFTGLLDALGLFDLFHSPWFAALWATIILSVTVCTVSRLRPTWRSVSRPRKLVSDAFIESSPGHRTFAFAGGPGEVSEALERRRYEVEEVGRRGPDVYLFADKFAWARYGTFLSHLALLVLLIGGLLTAFAGDSRRFAIAETAPAAPLFADPGPGQLFLGVLDAYRGVDSDGNVIDFHTDIEVRRGEATVSCRVTVNGPCKAFGYRVYQAAFFDDFVRLRLVTREGEVLFDDILDFEGRTTTVPSMLVTNSSGVVILEEAVSQVATDPGRSDSRADDAALGLLILAGSERSEPETIPLRWRSGEGFTLTAATAEGEVELSPGDSFMSGGFRVEFMGPVAIPATRIDGFGGEEGNVTFQLVRRASGSGFLAASGLVDEPLRIEPGATVELDGGALLTFSGLLEGAGLDVRRDPGDSFVWIGIVMALAGLAVTFYVPRRRVWAKVGEGRLSLACVAERGVRVERELDAIFGRLRGPTDI
ncbi:MAG: cytochrome c biogenesis protein ResB [Dehalococcoidia bacterium]